MTTSEVRHESRECAAALARAFGFLGKRWNGVLLGVLLGGPAGYAQLKRAVPGISDSMLSERLAGPTKAGPFGRPLGAGPPLSLTHQPTPPGQAPPPALPAVTTPAPGEPRLRHLPADPVGAGARAGLRGDHDLGRGDPPRRRLRERGLSARRTVIGGGHETPSAPGTGEH